MFTQASLRRHLGRVAPTGVPWAVSSVWWLTTQERPLRMPLRYLTLFLFLRLVLTVARVPARWRLRPGWLRKAPPWWAVPLALTTVCAVLFPAVMLGFDTLAGWDFPLHAWHTHVLANELLPSLRGWTWGQNFGWAEGDDYALAAYLPAALLHLLTFRVVDLEAAVALEVAAVTAGMPILVALFLGQGLPAAVVFVGGLLVLLDPGFFHTGGLVPLLVAGMWPVRLSMTLCVAAMWAADRYVQRPSRKALWAAILLTAAAAQTHAVGVTYVGAALLVWLVLRAGEKIGFRRWALLLGGLVAGMLTTGWLAIPFYALKEYQANLGEGTALVRVFLERLLSLGFYERATALEMALGVVGTVLLLQRQRHIAGRMALVGWALAALWLSLDVVTAALPEKHKELASRIQWDRYFFFGRTALMFAAGCALAWGVAWGLRWWLHPRRGTVAILFATGTLALAAAGLQDAGGALWSKSHLKRATQTVGGRQLPYVPSLEAAALTLQPLAPDTLLVVDLPLKSEVPTGHFAGWVNLRTGVPVMAVHRQGTFTFKDFGPRDGQNNYAELAASGATHWVSVGPPTGNAPPLTELATFPGDVHLYALPRLSADQRVNSSVAVTVTEWGTERVSVQGPDTGFEVALRMRWHPRWQVSGGQGVAVDRGVFTPGSRPVFTRLRVPPGVTQVTLTYGPAEGSTKGLLVTFASVLLLAALVIAARRNLG